MMRRLAFLFVALVACALVVRAQSTTASQSIQASQVAPGTRVRVGGDVKQPAKIRDVKPVYPEIARAAQVQGIVIIETIIGVDGAVSDARVLRSVPLLDEAALDAVRQWQFTPTSLNGVPVEVIMTVTVNFSMAGNLASAQPLGALAPQPTPASGAAQTPAGALTQPATSGVLSVPGAVRVGGAIKEPRKLRDVKPEYPEIAQAARVQGIVILEIAIDPAGAVSDAAVLRGVPLLNQAALDAVRQWVFEPTFLNGVAVPIIMTVTVNFSLQ